MEKKLDALERLLAVGLIVGGFMLRNFTVACIGVAYFIYKL